MTKDNIDIEQLVRIAAQEDAAVSRRRLFQALGPIELFFPLKAKRHEGKEVKATPLLRLSDGTNAMMLYTSKSHPDLSDTFGGGTFKDTLVAALRMPALDWVILSNRDSQRVAISKQSIPAVLDDLSSYRQDQNSPLETLGSGPSIKILEDLITRAVGSTPEELSPPIKSVLPGRELYLELTSGKSGRQPTMKTSQVGGIPRVIRAYLTRSRQDISYGGIEWNDLKEMIRNTPEIDGVQIVNDADDWVVFDRESLGLGSAEEA